MSILLLVFRRLRIRGHEVLFAVKDPGSAQHLLAEDGFRFVQCPRAPGNGTVYRDPVSFADILAQAGFADSGVLCGLVRAWQNLFNLYWPDVVVAQYAPTAKISAGLFGIPCLELAYGFESPPDVAPFPCFRPWLNMSKETLLKKEQIILDNINQIRNRDSATRLANLQQAMKSDLTLFATFPEMDNYPGRTGGHFIGPLSITGDGVDIPWPEGGAFRVIAYLNPIRETVSILETLKDRGASVIAIVPGMEESMRRTLSHEHIRIVGTRVKLSPLLTNSDLSVTHANHGTVAALLLAGVPLLMIPTTIERWTLSSAMERLGTGIAVTQNRINADFGTALDNLLSNSAFRSAAGRFATKYADYDQECVLDRLVSTIERLPKWLQNKQSTTYPETTEP